MISIELLEFRSYSGQSDGDSNFSYSRSPPFIAPVCVHFRSDRGSQFAGSIATCLFEYNLIACIYQLLKYAWSNVEYTLIY